MRVCLLLGVMMSSCRRSVRAVLFLKILYLSSFLFIIIISRMKSKTTREIDIYVISFDPPPSLLLLNRTKSNLTNERKKRRFFFERQRECIPRLCLLRRPRRKTPPSSRGRGWRPLVRQRLIIRRFTDVPLWDVRKEEVLLDRAPWTRKCPRRRINNNRTKSRRRLGRLIYRNYRNCQTLNCRT